MTDKSIDLTTDLVRPSDVKDRVDTWLQISSGPAFFDAVKLAVHRKRVDELGAGERALADWSDWFHSLKPLTSTRSRSRVNPANVENWIGQAVRARGLIWCALRAMAEPFKDPTDAPPWFKRQLTADGNGVELALYLNSNKPWVWVAIRTLMDEAPARQVAEPVAFWNQNIAAQSQKSGNPDWKKTGGVLATLVLEVLGSSSASAHEISSPITGLGQFAHHPADLFTWHHFYDDTFPRSLQRAWDAAQMLYRDRKSAYAPFDARWRLLNRPSDLPILGPSASGAAARGLYFALNNQVEEPEVITLAEVEETDLRLLTGVDGVAAKVVEIAKHSRFDTIAVATASNKAEAELALGNDGRIRVVDVSALE